MDIKTLIERHAERSEASLPLRRIAQTARSNTLSLLLASGEAPVVFTTDSAFEKQFKVQYFEEGCIAPAQECMVAYDHIIFDHLQAAYGKAWRRSIRKDVVGLKQWKRKHSGCR